MAGSNCEGSGYIEDVVWIFIPVDITKLTGLYTYCPACRNWDLSQRASGCIERWERLTLEFLEKLRVESKIIINSKTLQGIIDSI